MPVPRHWINVTTSEDVAFMREDMVDCKRVVIDTETTGLLVTDEVFGIVFGFGDYADKKEIKTVYWCNFNIVDESIKTAVLEILRELFTTGKHNLIFHNASFDIRMILASFDIPLLHENLNDTMLMALVLCRWPAVGLKYLTPVILDRQPVWAREVVSFKVKAGFKDDDDNFEYTLLPADLIFPYACEDAQNTFELLFALMQFFRYENASLQTIYKLERRVVRTTAQFEYHGLNVDVNYFTALRERLYTELSEERKYYSERWGQYKNSKREMVPTIDSHDRLARILFEPNYPDGLHLPMELATPTPSGGISVKTDELAANFPDNEDVQRLARYQYRRSIYEKFIVPICEFHVKWVNDDGTPAPATVHTHFWQIKSTGRFSSGSEKKGSIERDQINLQNFPNDKLATEWEREYSVRRGVIAPQGVLFMTADFKAFEVAVLANASQDPKLVQHVLTGVDFHSTVGSMAYHRPYSDLRNHVDDLARRQRTMIKRTSFAFLYGAGVKRIARTTGITVEEAARIKDALSDAYPDMMQWWDSTYRDAAARGKIFTLCGRVRRIPPERAYTLSVNTVCQGTAADIMKYAHAELEVLLQGTKSRQVHTVHDEIHFHLHPDDVDLVPKIVRIMETRRFDPPNKGTYVPMIAELNIGPNWSAMRETTVEEIQNVLREMKHG